MMPTESDMLAPETCLPPEDRPISVQTRGFRRRLVKPWTFAWRPAEGERHRLSLPAGVEYNPSSPGLFRPIVPVSRLQVASLPHDALYVLQGESKGILERWGQVRWEPVDEVSRHYADRLFYQLLRACGVKAWRAWLSYQSIRLVGWAAWQEGDPKRKATLRSLIDAH